MRAPVGVGPVLCAAAAARPWERPSSPRAFASYLAASKLWHLQKTFSYVRGGLDGMFVGEATFERLNGADQVLRYLERGTATLAQPSGSTVDMAAYRRLWWDLSGPRRARVFFDDEDEAAEREELPRAARLFHEVDLATCAPFEHPCGPDMYTGVLRIESDEAFQLLWNVHGPRKQGSVTACFTRPKADSPPTRARARPTTMALGLLHTRALRVRREPWSRTVGVADFACLQYQ